MKKTGHSQAGNHLELKTHVLVENHIDDDICLHIIANNKLLDMIILRKIL
ncbi:Uncharacterised protein [Streptococcus pneumoniae]|nr:Uncharacterised protein [Streptococcus pneumoniae]